jgi:hypothetical protein
MNICPECQQVIDQASDLCPGCGAHLTAPATDEFAEAKKKSGFLSATVLWSVIVTILWAIAWFAVPWHLAGSKPAAELRARETLSALQEELAAYEASEGSYPRSLEALGDRARQATQAAQSARYTLRYKSGNPDVNGRINSFTLVARAGNFGFLNFYTDQTRVFRATLEDRPATDQDPLLKPNL